MKRYETAGLTLCFLGILVGMELVIGGSGLGYYCGASVLFAVSSAVLAVIFRKNSRKREELELEKEGGDKKRLELLEKMEDTAGLMMSIAVQEGQTTREERQKTEKLIQKVCDILIDSQGEIRQLINKQEEIRQLFIQLVEEQKEIREITRQLLTDQNINFKESLQQYEGIRGVIVLENQKILEIIQHTSAKMDKRQEQMNQCLQESVRNLLNVFAETTDEVMNKMTESLERGERGLSELEENIEITQKNTMKRIQTHTKEILEGLGEYENSIMECMKTLSNQYIQFEKFTDGVVQHITLMSSEDTEILRGLISEER